MSNGLPPDPDDFFAETRMSFGDHLEELRAHLWKAIAGFGIALVASFFFGHYVVQFITAPVKAQLEQFYERRARQVLTEESTNPKYNQANRATPFRAVLVPKKQWQAMAKGEDPDMPRPRILTPQQEKAKAEPPSGLRKIWNWLSSSDEPTDTDPSDKGHEGETYDVKVEDKDKEFVRLWMSVENPLYLTGDLQPATRAFLDIDNPTTLNVQEAFMVWFKVCVVCGIVIGSPWIFWQIWMFVAAGLYPHEKRLVHVYLPVSLFLFLAGVALCEFVVIPKAIEVLLKFNEWMGLKPDMRLNEWLSFAIWMPVIFGVSFQTPLVMLFLYRLGFMEIETFQRGRRYAWFALAVFAAVITPTPDALTMLFLWVPMSLLFELGIWMMKFSPNPPPIDIDEPADEMVEV